MIQLCPSKRPAGSPATSASSSTPPRRGPRAGTAGAPAKRPRRSRSRKQLAQRAHRILETEPQYIFHASFDAPDASREILGPPPEPARPSGPGSAPKGADFYVAYLYGTTLLTREQEQYWFRRMNFLKFRAHRLRRGLDPAAATHERVEQIEQLEREAMEIRNQIIQANLRLVVSLAKQYSKATNLKLEDLLSEGHMGLIRAVEKFDFARGAKLSTYATWSVINRFLAFLQKEQRQQQRYFSEPGELVNEAAERESFGLESENGVRELRRGLARILSRLSDRERLIIEQRFGLNAMSEPQTLPELGRRFGVTKERVRQLQVRALNKLRAFAAEERLEPPEEP